MDASVHQQIISLIERSQRILLCTHRKPDGDAVGSLMALSKSLTLLGKEVTATCADSFPETFDFLPDIRSVRQHVPGGRDFVVTLDCDQTEVDRLKYHLEDNKIHIVITPKKGHFVKENVSCQEKGGQYDLIMTVDVADIPQLGQLHEENADLFTSLPVVNIDHHVSNTNFGKINHIDVSASSTAEMLYWLIRDMEKHFNKTLIVPDVATFLLSGVTTDTGSFQNANTTPKAMEVAADLMDAGANQHDVIKYLFRTKKLSTLKLWGKILTKIEVDSKHRMVWSSITQQDLKQSGAHMDEAGDIIDELMVHAPEAEMVALFKEDEDLISVSFRSTTSQANVMEVAQRFGGGGHVQAAGVKFPGKTLPEVMNQVLAVMQEAQQQRLGLDGIVEEPKADAKQAPVTQVLDGFTAPQAPVSPTLEEKVRGGQPGVGGQKSEVGSPSATGGLPGAPVQPDLHQQARAAITAEQSQPGATNFQPSQGAQQQRPEKPQVDKRFEGEVPEYLKVDGQKPEVGGQRSEVGGQKPEVGGQRSEVGGQKPEVGGQRSEVGGQMPPVQPQPPVQPAAQTPVPPTPAPQTPPVAPTASQPAPGNQSGVGSQMPPAQPAPQPAPPTPAPAPQAPPANDGVKVSYGNAPAPAPTVPEGSSDVVVKTVGGQQQGQGGQDPGAKGQGPISNGQGGGAQTQQQGQGQGQTGSTSSTGDQGGGAAGAAATSQKPEPPKDPFALGDDGLTDIERALGGL